MTPQQFFLNLNFCSKKQKTKFFIRKYGNSMTYIFKHNYHHFGHFIMNPQQQQQSSTKTMKVNSSKTSANQTDIGKQTNPFVRFSFIHSTEASM